MRQLSHHIHSQSRKHWCSGFCCCYCVCGIVSVSVYSYSYVDIHGCVKAWSRCWASSSTLFTLCIEARIQLGWLANLLHDSVFICYACLAITGYCGSKPWSPCPHGLCLSYCAMSSACSFTFLFSLESQTMACCHPHLSGVSLPSNLIQELPQNS